MTQSAKVETTPSRTPPATPSAAPREGGNTSEIKQSLRGRDFADQEAMVAPGGEADAKNAPSDAPKDETGDKTVKTTPDSGKDKPKTEPQKPAPLGDGLVLTRDSQYTATSYVSWFANQLKTKIESWGLAFDAKTVRLASEGAATVMALDWSSAWGSKPTGAIDFGFRPIDARAASTAVHALTGWAKVPTADQPRVDALIGGQTNDVSVAGRNNLRPKFAGLGSKAGDEQASTLTGLLGAKDSAPAVVSEQVETSPVTVTLTGPTVQKDYAFRGTTADAEIWKAAYSDGVQLTIVAPKAPDPKYHQHSVQEAADAATYLPAKNRKAINTVLLNTVENPEDKTKWAVEYHDPDFHSYMTAGKAGVVTIYPNAKKAQPSTNYMRGTMIHETGHAWSYQNWGEDKTTGKWVEWKDCMTKDKNKVSQYAGNSISEDVAETVQVYGSTKGKPKFDEYKALTPNRFAMLAKELG